MHLPIPVKRGREIPPPLSFCENHRHHRIITDDQQQLVVVGRWDIATPNAEGIAFVATDSDAATTKLYIAGAIHTTEPTMAVTDRSESGVIDVYDVPNVRSNEDDDGGEGNTKLTGHRLNAKVIGDGLLDSKISSLHYFEGLLYALHDNAKVVRVWDLEQGTMVSEWSLPRVDGRGDKQWEGLALERRSTSNANLRGSSSSSSLILHLSLDSPPQIWSLAVKEGKLPGQILLPSCATPAK